MQKRSRWDGVCDWLVKAGGAVWDAGAALLGCLEALVTGIGYVLGPVLSGIAWALGQAGLRFPSRAHAEQRRPVVMPGLADFSLSGSACDSLQMIRVTFLYPKTDESTFDMDYYISTHMPMLAAALGDDCKSWGADKVISGPYEAIGWALVSSAEAFGAATANGEISTDVSNYSNVRPDVVMGDVVR